MAPPLQIFSNYLKDSWWSSCFPSWDMPIPWVSSFTSGTRNTSYIKGRLNKPSFTCEMMSRNGFENQVSFLEWLTPLWCQSPSLLMLSRASARLITRLWRSPWCLLRLLNLCTCSKGHVCFSALRLLPFDQLQYLPCKNSSRSLELRAFQAFLANGP